MPTSRWTRDSALVAARAKFPRAFCANKPKSYRYNIKAPAVFPSNLLYGRPRSIDRTVTPLIMMPMAATAAVAPEPKAFRTHAEANEAVTGMAVPDNWNLMKLAEKQEWYDDKGTQ